MKTNRKGLVIMENNKAFVVLHINAPLQPRDRGALFEDGIDEVLKNHKIGSVCGGGTLMKKTGGILSCDIEFEIDNDRLEDFTSFLKKIDLIPKGSVLEIGAENIALGTAEGLALYLNGTELSDDVYKNNDINELIALLGKALGRSGEMYSYWGYPSETALYFYGSDYGEMNTKIADIVRTHPLCEKCRIEKMT